MRRIALTLQLALSALALSACVSKPVPPDWQMNARSALEQAAEAWLAGNQRLADAEFRRARSELARTGRADLLARAELSRCAWQLASLALEPAECPGYAALAADAGPGPQAYADYLAGRPAPAALLPAAQAQAQAGGAAALAGIADPLARLVAAGVLWRAGKADAGVAQLAVDTASAQGWRRPLLAWLQLQQRAASQQGDAARAAALQRRMDLIAPRAAAQ